MNLSAASMGPRVVLATILANIWQASGHGLAPGLKVAAPDCSRAARMAVSWRANARASVDSGVVGSPMRPSSQQPSQEESETDHRPRHQCRQYCRRHDDPAQRGPPPVKCAEGGVLHIGQSSLWFAADDAVAEAGAFLAHDFADV